MASYLLIPADDDHRRSEHRLWLRAFLFYGCRASRSVGGVTREILPGKTTTDLYGYRYQEARQNQKLPQYLVYLQGCNEQFIEARYSWNGDVGPLRCRVLMGCQKSSTSHRSAGSRLRACYQLVKEHDRVGRMADTQEFENFVLEKRHISPALMELLLQEAAEKITDLGEQIVIRHLYIERRMVPLNIWLEQVEGSSCATPLKIAWSFASFTANIFSWRHAV